MFLNKKNSNMFTLLLYGNSVIISAQSCALELRINVFNGGEADVGE